MKKRLFILVIIAVTVIAAGVGLLLMRKAKPPVLVNRTDPPRISFEERTHDLGTVMEGVEVPYVFKIQNVGGEPLLINDVSTSCGCTLLELKDKRIEPGKTGELQVVMDTAMKQGYVKKEILIFSNDPTHPKTSVFLAATVAPDSKKELLGLSTPANKEKMPPADMNMADPHAGLSPVGRAKIFTGKCASCHVNMGKGKKGGDLYQADCAMCHGQTGEGGVGPPLVPGNYHDQEFLNRIQKTIRYGSDKHLSMPGFLKNAGGPLTDGEINSIVQYLQHKSNQVQNRQSDLPGG